LAKLSGKFFKLFRKPEEPSQMAPGRPFEDFFGRGNDEAIAPALVR